MKLLCSVLTRRCRRPAAPLRHARGDGRARYSLLGIADCARRIRAFYVRDLAHEILACGWLSVTGPFLRPLRAGTPFDQTPNFVIRNNDAKFGPAFARAAEACGFIIMSAALRAPLVKASSSTAMRASDASAWNMSSFLGERQLHQVLRTSVGNSAAPGCTRATIHRFCDKRVVRWPFRPGQGSAWRLTECRFAEASRRDRCLSA
ncbi:MAG: hypothetical protein JWO42_3334 [Chloroflexi bacterium]|nr:hypothetical protein [Chloroflexota bacterium]